MYVIIIIILTAIILSFVPLWPKAVKSGGRIWVNTWTKAMLVLNLTKID